MLNSIVLQLAVVGGLWTVDKLTSCEMAIISLYFFRSMEYKTKSRKEDL